MKPRKPVKLTLRISYSVAEFFEDGCQEDILGELVTQGGDVINMVRRHSYRCSPRMMFDKVLLQAKIHFDPKTRTLLKGKGVTPIELTVVERPRFHQ
jgi:hypothetical protein